MLLYFNLVASFGVLISCAEGGSTERPKRKHRLHDYLLENGVHNKKHFQLRLTCDPDLREVLAVMYPQSIEITKKDRIPNRTADSRPTRLWRTCITSRT